MVELLQHYSLSDILMFTILLALAIKSLISFFDWMQQHVKKIFNKEHFKINEKEELERRLQRGSEVMTTLKANQETTDTILNDLSAKISEVEKALRSLSTKSQGLLDSDLASFKSFQAKNVK